MESYQKLASTLATVVMILLAAIQAWYQRRQVQLMLKSSKSRLAAIKAPLWSAYGPLLLTVAVGTAIAWSPFFLPRSDQEPPLLSWGPLGNKNILGVIANGRAVWSKRDDFRLAGVMFHYSGTLDRYDVSGLSKSQLYDIEQGYVLIMISPTSGFLDENHRGIAGTTYLLLLVPNRISMSQFETIHQAQRLGVVVLGGGEGPP